MSVLPLKHFSDECEIAAFGMQGSFNVACILCHICVGLYQVHLALTDVTSALTTPYSMQMVS